MLFCSDVEYILLMPLSTLWVGVGCWFNDVQITFCFFFFFLACVIDLDHFQLFECVFCLLFCSFLWPEDALCFFMLSWCIQLKRCDVRDPWRVITRRVRRPFEICVPRRARNVKFVSELPCLGMFMQNFFSIKGRVIQVTGRNCSRFVNSFYRTAYWLSSIITLFSE